MIDTYCPTCNHHIFPTCALVTALYGWFLIVSGLYSKSSRIISHNVRLHTHYNTLTVVLYGHRDRLLPQVKLGTLIRLPKSCNRDNYSN